MPIFYFHVYDDMTVLDEEGRELPSVDAAKQAAIRAARELMCEELRAGRLVLDHRIEVEDEARTCLLVLPFGEAAAIES